MKILVWTNIAPAFWPLFFSKEEEEQWKKDNDIKLIEMNINKAPEKLYISYKGYGVFGNDGSTERIRNSQIEYTRTDVFIEKATEWLKKNADYYTWYDETEGESGMIDSFIDNFKNYMKGE